MVKTSEDNGDGAPPRLLGGTAIRPPERSGWEKISYILHDPKKGTYLTRTPKSWLLILSFYAIYYTCLAGFWYAMLKIFLITVEVKEPKYQLRESIIGVNPGVGVRPAQADQYLNSSMYWIDLNYDGVAVGKPDDAGSIGYATRMKAFFEPFDKNKNSSVAVDCSGMDDGQYMDVVDTFCRFDLSSLGPCHRFPYGFEMENGNVEPCLFVKLNRIWGFKPQPIRKKEDFPEGSNEEFVDKVLNEGDGKRIYIDCRGEFPADEEILNGNIEYYPSNQGIPLKYFPFNNINMNENALVALKLKNLPKDRLVHVECKAYYKGVVHSKKDKEGMVRFEVFLSSK